MRERTGGRGHFFAAAAQAKRRILVESARRKRRLKRGGGAARCSLDEAELRIPEPREDVLALGEALRTLAEEVWNRCVAWHNVSVSSPPVADCQSDRREAFPPGRLVPRHSEGHILK